MPEGDEWSADWNAESIHLAYEEATRLQSLYGQRRDAIDNRVVVVFGLASAIAALAPILYRPASYGPTVVFWAAALAAWSLAVGLCHAAYRSSELRPDLDPGRLLTKEWLTLQPARFRAIRIREMSRTLICNRDELDRKANYLGLAILCTAAEVLALAIALILTPPY